MVYFWTLLFKKSLLLRITLFCFITVLILAIRQQYRERGVLPHFAVHSNYAAVSLYHLKHIVQTEPEARRTVVLECPSRCRGTLKLVELVIVQRYTFSPIQPNILIMLYSLEKNFVIIIYNLPNSVFASTFSYYQM